MTIAHEEKNDQQHVRDQNDQDNTRKRKPSRPGNSWRWRPCDDEGYYKKRERHMPMRIRKLRMLARTSFGDGETKSPSKHAIANASSRFKRETEKETTWRRKLNVQKRRRPRGEENYLHKR